MSRAVSWWRKRLRAFTRTLDSENIAGFQSMYYLLIMVAGVYLAVVATAPPQNVEPVMGHPQYELWLGLNVICPAMTLLGRRLTKRAAGIAPGRPNPARGAAWMQLVGDGGVWGAIVIYVACIIETTEWGAGLYGVFFVFMGIPGGAMFTLRSARRLLEIRAQERLQ